MIVLLLNTIYFVILINIIESGDMGDISLSQAFATTGDEYIVMNGMGILSIAQSGDQYEISSEDSRNFGIQWQCDNGCELLMAIYQTKVNTQSLDDVKFQPPDVNHKRFIDLVSDIEIEHLLERQKNVNTRKDTALAFSVLQTWRESKNH